MTPRSKKFTAITGGAFALVAIALIGTQSFAADEEASSLLEAFQSSKISLQDAVTLAEKKTDLIAISADFEIEGDLPAYEIKLLTQDGQEMTLMVNALTGDIFAATDDEDNNDDDGDEDEQEKSRDGADETHKPETMKP